MNAPESWIEAGGHRLEARFIAAGREDASTLVFLHEGLGSMGLWRDFPDRLARATGHAALIWSRAGYGASDPCSLPRPLDYLEREAIDVLPEVIAAAGVRDYHLIGHSDGASIALVFAGAAERPGLRGVVCEAAHVFNEEVCVRAATRARGSYESGELRDRLARHHGANVDNAFYGWNDAWLDPGFRTMNLERFLPGVRVPCLVIQGVDDEYGTLAQVDAIEGGLGGSVETQVLPSCGHAPHRDQREAVLTIMTRFITTSYT